MKQVIEKISDHQVHCNSTHNKQDKEPKYPPTVNGHTHTHTHKCYLAMKSMDILTFVRTWMDLEELILSEISQTEKDKYCIRFCVESKNS